MRILFTIAVNNQWVIKTTDIKSAFLQGKELNRNVYLKTLKESGAPDEITWGLKHCLYIYTEKRFQTILYERE